MKRFLVKVLNKQIQQKLILKNFIQNLFKIINHQEFILLLNLNKKKNKMKKKNIYLINHKIKF